MNTDNWHSSYHEDIYWWQRQDVFLKQGGVLPPGKSFRDLVEEFSKRYADTFGPTRPRINMNNAPKRFTEDQQATAAIPPRRVRRAAAKAEKRKNKR